MREHARQQAGRFHRLVTAEGFVHARSRAGEDGAERQRQQVHAACLFSREPEAARVEVGRALKVVHTVRLRASTLPYDDAPDAVGLAVLLRGRGHCPTKAKTD